MNPTYMISSSGLLITLLATPFYQTHADVLEQAFSGGKASTNLRYRYETVDDYTKRIVLIPYKVNSADTFSADTQKI